MTYLYRYVNILAEIHAPRTQLAPKDANQMEMLALNNGSSEPKPAVITSMMSIRGLWNEGIPGICAISDLYERCRNQSHPIANGEKQKLESLALLQPDGHVHDTIKNVVLSAITGESLADMKLGSPIKHDETSIPSPEELTAVTDGIIGIQMAIMSAEGHGLTVEQIGIFVRNTPDNKKGDELWLEFTSRRDKPDAKEDYDFVDFIREVIADN